MRPTAMTERFGDYELVKRIATGGMAEIYLARHSSQEGGFGRPVVVKRMLPELAIRSDFVTMFLDEARLAANLRHPNVVQVFNLGQTDGSYFMAMELVDGPHLGALFAHSLRQRRPLPIELCVYICARAADGLDYAHDLVDPITGLPLHIVHRDISPQNILVSKHGDVKVTDFGVAKASTQEAKTRTGIIKGKVSYMSPEQCLGEVVDRRTDIFALGIVLYELLTRRRLFRDKSDLLVMQRITQENVAVPSSMNPAVSADLDGIVMKALEKKRDTRYSTSAELSEALDTWLALAGYTDCRGKLARWMDENAAHLGLHAEEAQNREAFEAPFTGGTPPPGPPAERTEQTASTPALQPIQAGPSLEGTATDRVVDETVAGATLITPLPPHALVPSDTGSISLTPVDTTSEEGRTLALSELPSRGPEIPGEPTVPDSRFAPKGKGAPVPLLAAAGIGLVVVVGLAAFLATRGGDVDDGERVAVGGDPNRDPSDKPDPVEDPSPKPVDDKIDAGAKRDPVKVDPKPIDPPKDDPPKGDTVTLKVRTTPSKVPIFLGDADFLGMSPLETSIAKRAKGTLVARFDSGAESLDVALDDAVVDVEITARVPLSLKSTPSGATAVISGPGLKTPVKVTTPSTGTVRLMPRGTYSVELSLSGYEDEKVTLSVDGKPVDHTVTLKRERAERPKPPRPPPVERESGEGLLTVICEPWASVKIGGKTFAATPVPKEKVKAGAQTITVFRKELGINEQIRVNVPKDGALKVVLVFEPDGKGGHKLKTKRIE